MAVQNGAGIAAVFLCGRNGGSSPDCDPQSRLV